MQASHGRCPDYRFVRIMQIFSFDWNLHPRRESERNPPPLEPAPTSRSRFRTRDVHSTHHDRVLEIFHLAALDGPPDPLFAAAHRGHAKL